MNAAQTFSNHTKMVPRYSNCHPTLTGQQRRSSVGCSTFVKSVQGTNVGTSESLAVDLTLQPWGVLKLSHSHAALVLWTISLGPQ